jgi:hypothetical protein
LLGVKESKLVQIKCRVNLAFVQDVFVYGSHLAVPVTPTSHSPQSDVRIDNFAYLDSVTYIIHPVPIPRQVLGNPCCRHRATYDHIPISCVTEGSERGEVGLPCDHQSTSLDWYSSREFAVAAR